MTIQPRIPTVFEKLEDDRERAEDWSRGNPLTFSAAIACFVTTVFIVSCLRVGAPPSETVVSGIVAGVASFLSLCVKFWLVSDLPRRSEPGPAAPRTARSQTSPRRRAPRAESCGVASAGAARARHPGGG